MHNLTVFAICRQRFHHNLERYQYPLGKILDG